MRNRWRPLFSNLFARETQVESPQSISINETIQLADVYNEPLILSPEALELIDLSKRNTPKPIFEPKWRTLLRMHEDNGLFSSRMWYDYMVLYLWHLIIYQTFIIIVLISYEIIAFLKFHYCRLFLTKYSRKVCWISTDCCTCGLEGTCGGKTINIYGATSLTTEELSLCKKAAIACCLNRDSSFTYKILYHLLLLHLNYKLRSQSAGYLYLKCISNLTLAICSIITDEYRHIELDVRTLRAIFCRNIIVSIITNAVYTRCENNYLNGWQLDKSKQNEAAIITPYCHATAMSHVLDIITKCADITLEKYASRAARRIHTKSIHKLGYRISGAYLHTFRWISIANNNIQTNKLLALTTAIMSVDQKPWIMSQEIIPAEYRYRKAGNKTLTCSGHDWLVSILAFQSSCANTLTIVSSEHEGGKLRSIFLRYAYYPEWYAKYVNGSNGVDFLTTRNHTYASLYSTHRDLYFPDELLSMRDGKFIYRNRILTQLPMILYAASSVAALITPFFFVEKLKNLNVSPPAMSAYAIAILTACINLYKDILNYDASWKDMIRGELLSTEFRLSRLKGTHWTKTLLLKFMDDNKEYIATLFDGTGLCFIDANFKGKGVFAIPVDTHELAWLGRVYVIEHPREREQWDSDLHQIIYNHDDKHFVDDDVMSKYAAKLYEIGRIHVMSQLDKKFTRKWTFEYHGIVA